jgi:hypothetical protein
MMVRGEDDNRKLERALTEAYRAQADPVLGNGLAQQVLRDIRQQTSGNARLSGAVWVDQLVWRTATVTAAVALVMAVCAVGVVRTTTGGPAGLLAEGFGSVPLLGDD